MKFQTGYETGYGTGYGNGSGTQCGRNITGRAANHRTPTTLTRGRAHSRGAACACGKTASLETSSPKTAQQIVRRMRQPPCDGTPRSTAINPGSRTTANSWLCSDATCFDAQLWETDHNRAPPERSCALNANQGAPGLPNRGRKWGGSRPRENFCAANLNYGP
jgi:hypothetical protein